MLVEAGHFALALALGLSLIQLIVPLWGTRTSDPVLMSVAGPAAFASLACIGTAFAILTFAYATSDFSVLNVVENSHTAKPFIYKLTGVWGNHEGSMLLWILILSLFGAFVYNTLGIPVAAGLLFPFFGILLSPIIAGAAMAASSVTVVTNANRLRFFRAKSFAA